MSKFNANSVPPVQIEWGEPLPLSSERYEKEAYPLEAFPEPLRAAVKDIATITKAPIAMCGVGVLSALSLAGQGLVDVKRGRHLTGPTSLFLLSIAESGERKTTVDTLAFAAIRKHQRELEEALEPELKRFKSDYEAWEAVRNGLRAGIASKARSGKLDGIDELREQLTNNEEKKPVPPPMPLLMSSSSTPEGLLRDLAKRWPSSSTISSEAGVVFGSHSMGADSVMRNLATLNVLWDGGEHINSRADEEKNFTVRGARFTMSLQVQHHVLVDFMKRAGELARGSGFLARFLLAWPESTQGTRFYEEPDKYMAGLARFDSRITQLLQIGLPRADEHSLALEPHMLELTPEAKAVWVELHDAIESELKAHGDYADVRDVASKAADNAARIAALFHLYEHGPEGAISVEHIKQAGSLAIWHLHEARRLLFDLQTNTELRKAAQLDAWLINWCKQQGTDRVNRTEIMRRGPNSIRRAEHLVAPLLELQELNRIRIIEDGRSKIIVLNPAVLQGGANVAT